MKKVQKITERSWETDTDAEKYKHLAHICWFVPRRLPAGAVCVCESGFKYAECCGRERLRVDATKYLAMAVMVSRNFIRNFPRYAYCNDEVISEAQLGLMKAVVGYKPWLGYRFTTYGMVCIYRHLQSWHNAQEVPSRISPMRLTPIGEKNAELADRVDSFEEIDLLDAQNSIIAPLLKRLRPKELLVIRQRFWNEMTLEEAGKAMGVCKERIRQIEAQALRKMGMSTKD